jgi:thioester reductase-like protein
MNNYFITGSTGVVGSAVVSELLARGSVQLQLLIRAKDQTDLDRRLSEMLRFWEIPADSDAAKQIKPFRGDITLPRFGLTDAEYEHIASTTTHVIHSAAIVKMTLPLEEARHSAVTSVKSILELANECRSHGVLQKVDIVSTVGVAGLTPGLIPEEPMPDVQKFHNTYEASKSEAERFIFQNRGDLPVTLHRPSMVVGNSKTGKIIHFQVFYHLCEFLSGRHTRGLIPKTGGVFLDTVPVDYVARAITYSSLNPDQTAGKLFHLCSGPKASIPIPALVDRVRNGLGSNGDVRTRAIPSSVFRRSLSVMAWFANERGRKALRNLPLFLDYLDFPQQFSNARSEAFFNEQGIELPLFSDYLPAVLDFYGKNRPVPVSG